MQQQYTYTMSQTICDFIPKHMYILDISKADDGLYECIATYDITEDENIDLYIRLSSKASIDRYFKAVDYV